MRENKRKLVDIPLFMLVVASLFIHINAWSQGIPETQSIRISFVSPNPPGDGFWHHYESVMKVAANDLGIELTIIHASDIDRFAYLDALNSVDKINTDYVVVLMRHNIAENLLEMFKDTGIKVFASNMDVPNMHKNQVGNPRGQYKNWIGHMMPDDYHAGSLLASELIARDDKVMGSNQQIIAISGSRDSSVSFLRNAGLVEAISSSESWMLMQTLHTDWRYSTALERFKLIRSRFADTRVIWCASDEIAQAVLDGLTGDSNKDTFLVGGIDWSEKGIKAYGKKPFVVSVGGHFLEGGIILSLLKDYHMGNDFQSLLGLQIRMQMSALNDRNIGILRDLIVKKEWQKLNFKKVNKTLGGQPHILKGDYEAILLNIYEPN